MNSESTPPDVEKRIQFCPVCSKSFWQETSYVRHVQYCRRRHHAAGHKVPRQKSCHACSRAKTKCDLKVPCSRCHDKKLSCIYATKSSALKGSPSTSTDDHGRATSLSLRSQKRQEDTRKAELPVESVWDQPGNTTACPTDLQQDSSHLPQSSNYSTELAIEEFFDDADPIELLTGSSSATFDTPPSDFSGSLSHHSGKQSFITEREVWTSQQNNSWLVDPDTQGLDSSLAIQQSQSLLSPDFGVESICSIAPDPSKSLLSASIIPNSCRFFLASVLRGYPIVLTQRGTVPALMHCVGAEYVDANQDRTVIPSNREEHLSGPLAICHNISGIFLARTTNTAAFLWRTIDAEQLRLREQTHTFSRDETLAAVQAVILYGVMLYSGLGAEYFLTNAGLIVTLEKLLIHLQMWGYENDDQDVRLAWSDWIFEEVRRRIALASFLVGLMIYPQSCPHVPYPSSIRLPCNKALWEADDKHKWQKEYDLVLANSSSGLPQPRTVGELVLMLKESAHSQITQSGVDAWTAGQDELGMLVLAVASAKAAGMAPVDI